MVDLSSKRVLLLGADTDIGGSVATALAGTGARLALVGATNNSEAAFAVQRLARKLGAETSQAIDATNEMAVRVMVRQVSKALGGLDAVIFVEISSESTDLIRNSASREFKRSGVDGIVLTATSGEAPSEIVAALAGPAS